MKDSSSRSRTGMQAVERLIRVIHAVENSESMRLSEIARLANLNEATTLRYLDSLASASFVNREGQKYRLGTELARIGIKAFNAHARTPMETIRPAMTALLSQYGETVNLAMNLDDSIIIIDSIPGTHAVKKVSQIGETNPWHASALGKAILASMSQERMDAVIEQIDFQRYTPHSLPGRTELLEAIAQAQENGFAFDLEELDKDCTCVAAAIPSPAGGEPFYALSVSFVSQRASEQDLNEIGNHIKQVATSIPLPM